MRRDAFLGNHHQAVRPGAILIAVTGMRGEFVQGRYGKAHRDFVWRPASHDEIIFDRRSGVEVLVDVQLRSLDVQYRFALKLEDTAGQYDGPPMRRGFSIAIESSGSIAHVENQDAAWAQPRGEVSKNAVARGVPRNRSGRRGRGWRRRELEMPLRAGRRS